MDLGNGSGLSAADILALTGNNNNDGFGGSGAGMGWWLILLILVLGGGFWGGRGYAGNNGGGGNDMMAAMAMPYMYNTGVQQGFDQSAIMTALTNLNTMISNGFANAAVDSCNKTMTLMQGQNAIQSTVNGNTNDILMQMSNNEMARQQCCCDAKLQMANFQATMLAEHCSDRAEVDRAMNQLSTQMSAGFQGVYDRLSQQEIEALKRENENLRTQVNLNNLAASQNAQTQQLIANNQAQTDRIMDFINPGYARPFYGWPQMQPQTCCGNA